MSRPLFVTSDPPHAVAERVVRDALEQLGEGELVLLEEGGFPPGLVRELWSALLEKHLPRDRVSLVIGTGAPTATTLFFCRECAGVVGPGSCPHPARSRMVWSDGVIREALRSSSILPAGFLRPEVEAALRRQVLVEVGVLGEAAQPEAGSVGRPGGAAGFVLWFTGLSGSGKSTLSRAVGRALSEDGLEVEVLDGDEVRSYLSKGLGFSREDRDTNVRRIGYVARLLARHGTVAITAAISPYADIRREVRERAEAEGIPFVEVYAQASLEALTERDVKGLYRKALAGELPHFTGVSDPYEPPSSPEVVVRTDVDAVDVSTAEILEYLRSCGLLADERRAA